jgi:hypothetical protein
MVGKPSMTIRSGSLRIITASAVAAQLHRRLGRVSEMVFLKLDAATRTASAAALKRQGMATPAPCNGRSGPI